MRLTEKDRQVLANFYDSPTYTIFKKHFLTNRQMELAQETVNMRVIEGVTEHRGRVMELNHIDTTLRKIYKREEVKEKS